MYSNSYTVFNILKIQGESEITQDFGGQMLWLYILKLAWVLTLCPNGYGSAIKRDHWNKLLIR